MTSWQVLGIGKEDDNCIQVKEINIFESLLLASNSSENTKVSNTVF
jgi:hypothetical protein